MKAQVNIKIEVPDQDRLDDIELALGPILSFMGDNVEITYKVEGFPMWLLDQTVSHGTLRTEDLIQALGTTLQEVDPETFGYENQRFLQQPGDAEDHSEYLTRLFDALENAAPEGYRFGAIEGDGSDFGFWQIEEEEDTVPIQSVMDQITLCPKCREAYNKSDGHDCQLDREGTVLSDDSILRTFDTDPESGA